MIQHRPTVFPGIPGQPDFAVGDKDLASHDVPLNPETPQAF